MASKQARLKELIEREMTMPDPRGLAWVVAVIDDLWPYRVRHKRGTQQPQIQIDCACGATWKGRYAVESTVVKDHLWRRGCRLSITGDDAPYFSDLIKRRA